MSSNSFHTFLLYAIFKVSYDHLKLVLQHIQEKIFWFYIATEYFPLRCTYSLDILTLFVERNRFNFGQICVQIIIINIYIKNNSQKNGERFGNQSEHLASASVISNDQQTKILSFLDHQLSIYVDCFDKLPIIE